jgi:hypothetical protein
MRMRLRWMMRIFDTISVFPSPSSFRSNVLPPSLYHWRSPGGIQWRFLLLFFLCATTIIAPAAAFKRGVFFSLYFNYYIDDEGRRGKRKGTNLVADGGFRFRRIHLAVT